MADTKAPWLVGEHGDRWRRWGGLYPDGVSVDWRDFQVADLRDLVAVVGQGMNAASLHDDAITDMKEVVHLVDRHDEGTGDADEHFLEVLVIVGGEDLARLEGPPPDGELWAFMDAATRVGSP
jgi:hypothetical protein